MFMYMDKKKRGRTEGVCVCVCVCMFLSFPSIKQSLFSFPGFKRNLFPGVEPSLTLTLSLCCSIAPIVVSRELFHNHQPKKKKKKKKFHMELLPSKYFLIQSFSLTLHFLFLLYFQTLGSGEAPGHVAASSVCISSALFNRAFK